MPCNKDKHWICVHGCNLQNLDLCSHCTNGRQAYAPIMPQEVLAKLVKSTRIKESAQSLLLKVLDRLRRIVSGVVSGVFYEQLHPGLRTVSTNSSHEPASVAPTGALLHLATGHALHCAEANMKSSNVPICEFQVRTRLGRTREQMNCAFSSRHQTFCMPFQCARLIKTILQVCSFILG